jgi:hypothetical protein
MPVNYFLYIVTSNNPKEDIRAGEDGWGYCSFKPGIMDAPYGTMYVAPASYIDSQLSPRTTTKTKGEQVKRLIYLYYGLLEDPN